MMSRSIFLCTLQKYFLTFTRSFSIIHSMKDYQKRPWSHEERKFLKEYYGKVSMKRMLDILPHRSENSIRKQVYYLRQRGWTFN